MKRVIVLFLLVGMIGLVGCTTTQKGAGVGAAAGGALGAIIGHQSGHTAGGAAIGAVTGGLAGALIGEAVDRKFCPLCGKHFPSNVQFCPDCGVELQTMKK